MARSLPVARAAFVSSMKRETSGPDLIRLVGVLDALIKWSVARPRMLGFQEADSAPGIISFVCADSKTVCWSARVTRGDAPKLEFFPPTGRSLTPEVRARVVETLNKYSREAIGETGRLRIGFGALKNTAALEAVLALLGDLVAATPVPVSAAS